MVAQVKEAEPHCQAAVITLTVSHAETDFGTEVQCLNALIKATVPVPSPPVPLRVVRMEGPDMCIGALAAMAAYPYLLLRAARLRQARVTNVCLKLMWRAYLHVVTYTWRLRWYSTMLVQFQQQEFSILPASSSARSFEVMKVLNMLLKLLLSAYH